MRKEFAGNSFEEVNQVFTDLMGVLTEAEKDEALCQSKLNALKTLKSADDIIMGMKRGPIGSMLHKIFRSPSLSSKT